MPDWRRDFFWEQLFDYSAIPEWEGVQAQQWVYGRYFE
jgi:hypothetical protein